MCAGLHACPYTCLPVRPHTHVCTHVCTHGYPHVHMSRHVLAWAAANYAIYFYTQSPELGDSDGAGLSSLARHVCHNYIDQNYIARRLRRRRALSSGAAFASVMHMRRTRCMHKGCSYHAGSMRKAWLGWRRQHQPTEYYCTPSSPMLPMPCM